MDEKRKARKDFVDKLAIAVLETLRINIEEDPRYTFTKEEILEEIEEFKCFVKLK